jgi:hypothetical protein
MLIVSVKKILGSVTLLGVLFHGIVPKMSAGKNAKVIHIQMILNQGIFLENTILLVL